MSVPLTAKSPPAPIPAPAATASSALDRPPYLAALVVSLLVLGGYVFSLAPSVTFWDAGELIASMRILGIPHPPGTPLFVLMGHVWANLIPFGEYAFRTNLLSAVCSAGAAGFWFLVVHQTLQPVLAGADAGTGRVLRAGGAAAAALLGAFTFTNWQNSNETEVYAVASLIIAAVAWLALRWRATRGTPGAQKRLLLIAYLMGISVANHLLALLAGPAVIAFLVAELRAHPAASLEQRRREWAHAAVVAGLWALLLGVGLGSTPLAILGGLCFLGSAGFAAAAGALPFALVSVVVALVGVTPYLFLYLRSPQHPIINEAAPETWNALLAVIRREQYPVRTPLDDPTELHGPDNPGRSLTIIGLQLVNYLQYFDWQWAKAVPGTLGAFPLRTVFTLIFLSLGLRGLFAHRHGDRTGWWLLFILFLVTGLGLVAYMNFKPGFSLGYDRYPRSDDHEVRERDYFFVISFIAWGLWAGVGLTTLVRGWMARLEGGARRLATLGLAGALVPALLNFRDADRGHGPDARLAGDFAYDLLNSAPPYGVLFTYGDNDTFPLWWAQEVAETRRDVTVVCLALAETDWYMRQLRDNPTRPFERERAPAIWLGLDPKRPDWPLHSMTDREVTAAVPQVLPDRITLPIGPYRPTLERNTVLYGKDFLSIRVIQQNFGRRPIAWGLTSGGRYYGLDSLIIQRGIGLHLEPNKPDTTNAGIDTHRMFGVALDLPMTERLLFENYRYADLLQGPHRELEPTAAGIAQTLGVPFTQMAFAAEARSDYATMVRYLERAVLLSSNPAIRSALEQARTRLPTNPR